MIPIYATIEELILTKYLRNSFLATKVAFLNEVFDLCETAGIDYNPSPSIGRNGRKDNTQSPCMFRS